MCACGARCWQQRAPSTLFAGSHKEKPILSCSPLVDLMLLVPIWLQKMLGQDQTRTGLNKLGVCRGVRFSFALQILASFFLEPRRGGCSDGVTLLRHELKDDFCCVGSGSAAIVELCFIPHLWFPQTFPSRVPEKIRRHPGTFSQPRSLPARRQQIPSKELFRSPHVSQKGICPGHQWPVGGCSGIVVRDVCRQNNSYPDQLAPYPQPRPLSSSQAFDSASVSNQSPCCLTLGESQRGRGRGTTGGG